MWFKLTKEQKRESGVILMAIIYLWSSILILSKYNIYWFDASLILFWSTIFWWLCVALNYTTSKNKNSLK